MMEVVFDLKKGHNKSMVNNKIKNRQTVFKNKGVLIFITPTLNFDVSEKSIQN